MLADLNYDFRFNFCSRRIYGGRVKKKRGLFFLLFLFSFLWKKKKVLQKQKGFRRCKNLSAYHSHYTHTHTFYILLHLLLSLYLSLIRIYKHIIRVLYLKRYNL